MKSYLRETRKSIINKLVANNLHLDSEARTKYFSEHFETILEESFIEIDNLLENKNLQMLLFEMITCMTYHNLQSVLICYRSFIIAYIKEALKCSKTFANKNLNTFSKAQNILFQLFSFYNHFENGCKQFNIDIDYEINLAIDKNIPEKERVISRLLSMKIDITDELIERESRKLEKLTKATIKFANKIAHSEIEFEENNDESTMLLAENSFNAIMNSIGMLVTLHRILLDTNEKMTTDDLEL